MSSTRFYKIWKGMLNRCHNKNTARYVDYGGRGIKVCKRWTKFESFRDDMLSGYDETKSIDRKNNNAGYNKRNCRWATIVEQNQNKRMQKLTPEKVARIRMMYFYGNGRKLAKQYGVSPGVISEIVNKKRNYGKIKLDN